MNQKFKINLIKNYTYLQFNYWCIYLYFTILYIRISYYITNVNIKWHYIINVSRKHYLQCAYITSLKVNKK